MTTTPATESPPSASDGRITLQLPPAVVPAGKRTTLSFFLAHPSFVCGLRWVPGFKLERVVIGQKDFGSGTGLIDGRPYREHRVLTGEQLQLHILNESAEDRTFAGSITIEVSHVIEDSDFACSLGDSDPGPAPPVLTCVAAT
jgi:hypothetical protein